MKNTANKASETQSIEIQLLLEGLCRRYGYDFRGYAPDPIKRRLLACLKEERLSNLSELQARVLHDPEAFGRLLSSLAIHVTSMFRDPSFFAAFRERAVPWLRAQPFLRFWVAGCSTGEEVYSLAILLEEEGLYSRSRIYATDLCEDTLAKAQAGVFPLAAMREYTRNYQQAGGRADFSDYYTAQGKQVLLRPALRRNMVFAQHNLVTDTSFNEFHAICCRNVMIYFGAKLQERVLQLFEDSLMSRGILCVGRGETLRFSPSGERYDELDGTERIYRRKT